MNKKINSFHEKKLYQPNQLALWRLMKIGFVTGDELSVSSFLDIRLKSNA